MVEDRRSSVKEEIITRLKRIEGQVKGIQRMVMEEKGCGEILTQIAAARAALNSVGTQIFKTHSLECLRTAFAEQKDDLVDELVDTFMRFNK